MILLTGNIGALLGVILVIALLIVVPFGLLSWYVISKTRLYRENYENGTSLKRTIFLFSAWGAILLVFILMTYCVFTSFVE